MADQEYKVKISLEGAEQAAAGTKKVDTAIGGMGKKAYDAGVAFFAAGGIIAAYQKLSSLSDVAIKTDKVGKAFESLTAKAKFTGDTLGQLQTASRGMVSNFELMRQANNAMLLGVATSSDQLAEMATISRRLGAAMGIDAAQAMESLTIGLGRQSKLYLDNLGIIIDVEAAYKKYAQSLGVSVEMLTEQQKKLAFTNETMIKARELVSGLGDDTATSADKVAQFRTEWENTKETLGKDMLPLLKLINGTIGTTSYVLGALVKGENSAAFNDLNEAFDKLFMSITGITPEMRELALATKDANSTASDFVTATITLQQVEEARANALAFQNAKAKGFADEEKKRQEEATKKAFEAMEGRFQAQQIMEDSARAYDALMQEMNVSRLEQIAEETQAELDRAYDIRKTRQELDDWIISEGERLFAADSIGVSKRGAEIEKEIKDKERLKDETGKAARAMIGTAASLNQAFKGSAVATKRLLQAEALVNTYAAANDMLKATAKFGPAISFPLVALTVAQGLANVAQIQSQNYREGGVIDGVGGPRQDNIHLGGGVFGSNQESILNAEATARLGRDGVDRINNGGSAGVTVVINGGMIGSESFVRDVMIPQIEASLKRRLA